jgi:deoxyribodipyrimidine photo-lyase
MKKTINLLWLRRDIRVTDHQALDLALNARYPIFIFYALPHRVQYRSTSSSNHKRFILQAIQDLQSLGIPVHFFECEVEQIINDLQENFEIKSIFSHHLSLEEEDRQADQYLKSYLLKQDIQWNISFDTPPRCNTISKDQSWHHWMLTPIQSQKTPHPFVTISENLRLPPLEIDPFLAIGTREQGLKRIHRHCELINKNEIQWRSETSEISPYISWGLFSVREVYQICSQLTLNSRHKKSREQFLKRLQWQAIMMDQFANNPSLEFSHPNSKNSLSFDRQAKRNLKKWKNASTGEALIDASLRCVIKTGQLSFKKRSLIVSYLTHQLRVPWQKGATFLARCFLDYHPGVHYPQFFRVLSGTPYNIESQERKLDPHKEFQAQWMLES